MAMPGVIRYELEYELEPQASRVEARVQMVVQNHSCQEAEMISLLLYRLFEIRSVTDGEGHALIFTQEVVKITGLSRQQVNCARIQPNRPLKPQETLILRVVYDGELYGYPEVWGYIRDRVEENFSLLRIDTFAYPLLAEPHTERIREAMQTEFSYDLQVCVPAGLTAACGGKLLEVRNGERSVCHFVSKTDVRRLDLAVSRYAVLERDCFRVYYFPGHAEGAERVLSGMMRAFAYFSETFGELVAFPGYTVIEIPDGFGSQAGVYYTLQTEPAFLDERNLPELFHELGHSWNAFPEAAVAGCRWFDEAFASYFQALAAEVLITPSDGLRHMELYRTYYKKWVERDQRCFDIPIAEYGIHDLGFLSYTKGPWSLYVLHHLLGDTVFTDVIRTFLEESRGKQVNFTDFRQVAERVSGRNLEKYFADWIFGNTASQWLTDDMTVDEMTAMITS